MITETIDINFKNYNILHYYSISHIIIKTRISNLLEVPVIKWKYNRQPDLERSTKIATEIYNNRSIIDSMLYFNYNSSLKKFECYDGLHRLSAINIIYNENKKPSDQLENNLYGSNSDALWLYNQYVIINIRYNHTEGQLLDAFKAINNSCPIADIYIKDTSREKIEMIEKIREKFKKIKINKKSWKNHFKDSNKPQRPNINNDIFIDFIDKIYDKYNIELLDYEEGLNNIMKYIMDANNNVKGLIQQNFTKYKLTSDMKEKCEETDCYLFLFSLHELIDIV
jgi:hypothetical protein